MWAVEVVVRAVIVDGAESGVMRVRPQAELEGVGEVSLSFVHTKNLT